MKKKLARDDYLRDLEQIAYFAALIVAGTALCVAGGLVLVVAARWIGGMT